MLTTRAILATAAAAQPIHPNHEPKILDDPAAAVSFGGGGFAINNSLFGVIVMLVAGVMGFYMERWGFPVAPTILGVVLGTMLEEHFFSSLVKADGNFLVFFERPIAGALGAVTLLIWLWPVLRGQLGRLRSAGAPG